MKYQIVQPVLNFVLHIPCNWGLIFRSFKCHYPHFRRFVNLTRQTGNVSVNSLLWQMDIMLLYWEMQLWSKKTWLDLLTIVWQHQFKTAVIICIVSLCSNHVLRHFCVTNNTQNNVSSHISKGQPRSLPLICHSCGCRK